jgi:cell division septal protein FtsQ
MAKAKAVAKSKPKTTKKPPAKTSEKTTKAAASMGQKAVRERERKKQQLKRKRYISSGLAIIIIGGGFLAYQQRVDQIIANYTHMLWVDSTKAAGFTFEEAIIKGRRLTPREDLSDAIGIDFGESLFAQSLDDIHHRLLNLQMVKEACFAQSFRADYCAIN